VHGEASSSTTCLVGRPRTRPGSSQGDLVVVSELRKIERPGSGWADLRFGCPPDSDASRTQRGPSRHAHQRVGRWSMLNARDWLAGRCLARRTIVGPGRRQRQLRGVAARASPLFQVPPFVEVAAGGRVVPGQLGVTIVRGAGSGVAEAMHPRLRVRAAAPALLQHRHARSVTLGRPRQPLPLLLLHQGGGDRPVVGWAATRHVGDGWASRLTGLFRMVGRPWAGTTRPRIRPWSAFGTWLTRPRIRFAASARKPVKQQPGPGRAASTRPAVVSELRGQAPRAGGARPSDQLA
jgi:hypothetical protein